MRPRRLTLTAFGPYPDTQSIDFDALRDDGLFLIHGATGSGKTFLLDALSFALYGEIAGGRAVASLRSDHAPPGAEPAVALEFDAQGEQWLVERVPAHQRLGLRSGAVVDKPARATLSRRVGTGWHPDASGVKEVSLRVLDLIGLTARQFRQVIVLPQGAVEAVLRATSETREDLLKTLFDSVLYESVALHLDRRAKEAAATLQTTETDLARLRDQATERWLEVERTDDGVAPGGSIPVVEDQTALDQLATSAEAQALDAGRAATSAEDRAAEAARACDQLRDLARRRARRRELLMARAALAAADPEIAERRRRLHHADAAETLRPTLVEVGDGATAAAHAAIGVGDAARTFATSARRAGSTAVPAAVEPIQDLAAADPTALAPAALVTARHGLTVRRTELQALVELADRRRRLLADADADEREAAELERRVAEARARRSALVEREAVLRDRVDQATGAAGRLDGLEAEARAAAGRAAAASRLDAAGARIDACRSAHLDADRALQDARATLNDRRAAHLDGIAAVLAGHLRDGEPCLVCGNDVHPRPAAVAAGAVDTDDIARAEQAVDAALAAERVAEHTVRDALDAERRLRDDAGPAAADAAAAIAAAEAAIELVQEAAATAASRPDLEDALADLARATAAVQRVIDADAPAAAVGRERAETGRAQAAACADQLRTAAGDGTEIERALAVIDSLIEALADLADRAAEHGEAVRARDDAQRRLHRLLEHSPFPDPDTAAAALAGDQDRAAWRTAIDLHDLEVANVHALLDAPDLADLPVEPTDLDRAVADAATAAALAAGHARQALEQRARLADASRAVAELAERHRTLDHQVRAHRAQLEVTARVADQCMGRNDDKVSLQRWVLSTYLEEICELATRRLLTMTSHRYSLRVHRERASRGAKSGLDLRVFDAHTGEERTVQSLSGGETFQASLALALAVADSVQQHTGGVHLDALFVDEGFGALDAQALELALDELDKLRSGGRMVGVISHVGALRERIRVGIEVTGSARGSHVRVGEIAAA